MSEFLTLMENWDGFRTVRSANISEAALAGALALITNEAGYSSRKHAYLLEEAVGTGDFPTLFGALIEREMLANYKAVIPDWRSYVKVGSLPNFNTHEYHKVVGQDDSLDAVAEFGPYLEEPSVTGHYDRRVFKFGRRFGISFESLINDSMGAFADISQRFLTAVLRTESRNAALSFVSATGPSPALFGAPITDVDGQNVTNLGVLPFSIPNLQTTLTLMGQQTDANGERIAVRGVHLVVPETLEFAARQAITSTFVQHVDTIGGANAAAPVYVPLPTTNVLPQYGLQLHVNTELTAIDVSGTGDTTWYLFAEPSQGIAAGLDYLRGFESPEVCMKASNKVSVSGGPIGAMSGDFDNDTISYRVRCFNGPWHGDPRFCYAQVGP